MIKVNTNCILYLSIIQVCLIIFIISACSQVFANDVKLIKVGKGDWPPYVCEAKDNDGKLGYASDMIRMIYEKAGYTVKFITVNYSRGIKLARSGKHTIMACMYEEDAPDLIFPKVLLGKSVNSFFVKTGNSWRFKGLQSLSKVKIGLVHGYKYPEFQNYIDANPENFIHLTGKDPLHRILKMIKSDRLDATFDDRKVVIYEARKIDMEHSILDAGGFELVNKVLIGFSPKDSRTLTLVKLLEEGIINLRKSGELVKILEEYKLSDWETNEDNRPLQKDSGINRINSDN